MDVTVTVVDDATGARADAQVTTAPDTPAAAVLDGLRTAVGAAADAGPLVTSGRRLDPTGTADGLGLTDGLLVTVGGTTHQPPAAAGVTLVTRTGPDAGRLVRLPPGVHVVGRGPDCDVTVADPALSRRHAELTVTTAAMTVTDVSSRNETAGAQSRQVRSLLVRPGESFRIGDTELALPGAEPATTASAFPDGLVLVHRAPRLRPAPATVTVAFPVPPTAPPPARFPMLATIVPLVAGLVLAVALRQWQYVGFIALSPFLVVGQTVGDRWAARVRRRADQHSYDMATRAARAALATALTAERARRLAAAPDCGQLACAAHQRSDQLWQRSLDDPDALELRLGLGAMPSEIEVSGGPGRAQLSGVPVQLRLADVGLLGVTGGRDVALGLARALLLQAVTLHGPGELSVVCLAPGGAKEWSWVRWLPHATPRHGQACTSLLGLDTEQVGARVGELAAPAGPSPRTTVVVVDAGSGELGPGVRDTLTSLGESTTVVWLAGEPAGLPARCRAVAHLDTTPSPRARLARDVVADIVDVIPDLVSRDVAETVARSLAPLRDAGGDAAAGLPATARWAEVNRVDLDSIEGAARSLTRRWSAGPSTELTLGPTVAGHCVVDLCRDGPHVLVAGTTGAGKSELLRSMVASLVTNNRPDQLSLLLIDYKGGAAFGSCDRLPHTTAVVTDLDAGTTTRALESLTAELRRRESVLATVGAADLEGYAETIRRTGRSDPVPARLVIVVDEFATLADELPDFVGGLVGIAQRGRSLGVHLVLATQRPQGVVSADIRANTRMRICLAVPRESESQDVIDAPDAAGIDHTIPGRGYLRVGPGELREFQTARVGTPQVTAARSPVSLSPALALGRPPTAATTEPAARSDLDVVVEAAIRVSHDLGCRPAPAPWLPPLPDRLSLSSLARDGEAPGWGVVDLPSQQRQDILRFDPAVGGPLLVTGTARSGRTAAAAAVVTAVAAALPPDAMHIWAIDAGGGLRELSSLPHCGGVIPAAAAERVALLLDHLVSQVAERRASHDRPDPLLMLVLDSWEPFTAAVADRDGGRLPDVVLRLAADGAAAGLRVLVTADRSGLTGRLPTVAPERIVLRLADPADFTLAGMARRGVPDRFPPGRGLRSGDSALIQVAEVDSAAVRAARGWPAAATPPRRFDPLPERVPIGSLLDHPSRRCRERRIVIGAGAADHRSVAIDPTEVGTTLLVAGPPGSGRSTTLAVVAEQLTSAGRRVAVVCPRRSVLPETPGVLPLPFSDQQTALAMLDGMVAGEASHPDVLVDDIDLLPDGPLAQRLETLLRSGRVPGPGPAIVLAGTTDGLVTAFRGPIVEARRAGVGVLLRPSGPYDGEVLGLRLPRGGADEPPGRGWVISRGEATRVQVALPTALSC